MYVHMFHLLNVTVCALQTRKGGTTRSSFSRVTDHYTCALVVDPTPLNPQPHVRLNWPLLWFGFTTSKAKESSVC